MLIQKVFLLANLEAPHTVENIQVPGLVTSYGD